MNSLLHIAIKGHGGLESWEKYDTISARLEVGGLTWARKQQPGIVEDVWVTVGTKLQDVVFKQNSGHRLTAHFVNDQVIVNDQNGSLIETLYQPRKSFDGHKRESVWSLPQAFYFASYAIWIYFNAPFVFASPGYVVEEISPWTENGEQWRRLQVTFPEDVHTHSKIQTFYIDDAGLIRRHDYNVEISGNVASAHYLYDYVDVAGIKFPTRRLVFLRKDDNTSLQPEPLFVKVNVEDLKLQ